MEFEVISKEELLVGGLKTELTTSQKENFRIIRLHWQKFNKELRRKNNRGGRNWKKFGITFRTGNKYTYLTAIPLTSEIGRTSFWMR